MSYIYARNPEVEILRMKFKIKKSEHELSTVMMRLIGFHPKKKGGGKKEYEGRIEPHTATISFCMPFFICNSFLDSRGLVFV